jgi:hypothetical protein
VIVAQAGNPFTKGTLVADTEFKVGDYYSYVIMDRETKTEKNRVRGEITAITDNEVIIGKGAIILDRLGNTVKLPNGSRFTPRQDQPLEYAIGKKWTTRFNAINAEGRSAESEFEFRITRREKITVPAGTFDCFVIEGDGYNVLPFGKVQLKLTRWMAPDRVRRPIATEQYRKFVGGQGTDNWGHQGRSPGRGPKPPPGIDERQELLEYKQT